MSDYEKQHFVPQIYLKHFSDSEGKINILNLRDYSTVIKVPYKNQCQASYFYGKNLSMEHLLHIVEDDAKYQIENIVKTSIVDVENKSYYNLINFIAIQCIRTEIATDTILVNINSIIEALIHNLPDMDKYKTGSINEKALITLSAFSAWPLLLDLVCIIFENESRIKFVTSDNPVCLYNQYLNDLSDYKFINDVFSSKGLIILYPLSYTKLMLLYDPCTYIIKNQSPIMKMENNDDVKKINLCQFINANRIVFFPDSFSDEIVNFAKNARTSYDVKYGIHKGINNNNPKRIPYNGQFSFIELCKECKVPLDKRKNMIRDERFLEVAQNRHQELFQFIFHHNTKNNELE